MPPAKRPPQTAPTRSPGSRPGGKKPFHPAGPSLPSKLLTELLGTALLTFTIAVAAGQGAAFAPVAIGSTLMCVVYAGGHVSGANYNPAVSFSLLLTQHLTVGKTAMYIAVQVRKRHRVIN